MVRIRKDLSGEFDYGKGVLQDDGLACFLFILALEKAMRDAGIDSSRTVFNRLLQILGYADDLGIIRRSLRAVTEAFLALEGPTRRLGLIINKSKIRSQDRKLEKRRAHPNWHIFIRKSQQLCLFRMPS